MHELITLEAALITSCGAARALWALALRKSWTSQRPSAVIKWAYDSHRSRAHTAQIPSRKPHMVNQSLAWAERYFVGKKIWTFGDAVQRIEALLCGDQKCSWPWAPAGNVPSTQRRSIQRRFRGRNQLRTGSTISIRGWACRTVYAHIRKPICRRAKCGRACTSRIQWMDQLRN